MSANLNKISAGCCINNVLINHLMYADDVVLMAPSAKGLQKLIDECFAYGKVHNIKFNCLKTVCMLVPRNGKSNIHCKPNLYVGDKILTYVDKCKHLGLIISCDLSDHADIERQIRRIYVNANILKREFYSCKEQVKL